MPSNDPNTSSAWARWIRILGNRWAVIRAMIPIDSSLNEIFTEDNPGDVNIANTPVDVNVVGGSGVAHTDDSPFAVDVDDVTPMGALFDDVAPDAIDEDDVGAPRMSENRVLYGTIRDGAGAERGANVDDNSRLETNIDRRSVIADATILNGANLSDEQDMRRYGNGNVYIPAAWTPADIGFHVAHTAVGTFVPLYDDNGNPVQITVGAVTDRAFSFPPEIFAVRYFKFWSQNAGIDQNQGGERDLDYELKA